MGYPATKPFDASQGETWRRTLTWKVDGTAVNLTLYTAAMQIRDTKGKLLASITSSSGITLGGYAGTIALLIAKSVTSAMPSGSHDYDLELTSSGGETTPLIAGKFNIRRETTR